MALIREDNLQLTLLSNASAKLYPKNRPNCFTTKLCKSLDFGGCEDWEVALMNIQYPVNWPNVLESSDLAFIVEMSEIYRDNAALKPPTLPENRAVYLNTGRAGLEDNRAYLLSTGDKYPTSRDMIGTTNFKSLCLNS